MENNGNNTRRNSVSPLRNRKPFAPPYVSVLAHDARGEEGSRPPASGGTAAAVPGGQGPR